MIGSESSTRRSIPRGFTLVEIVVVLIIVSVLISMAAVMTRGVVAAQKRSLTATRLAGLDAALAQFVSQQKRLPCPADGTVGPGVNGLGLEANPNPNTGCTAASLQNGVVPWRSLGLTEQDATDGWGRRITYRVGTKLAADSGMDLSFCDPAGNPGTVVGGSVNLCSTGCTAGNMATCTLPSVFLAGKGLLVKDLAGNRLMDPVATPHTGAAYVLISAGESGGGAYLNSGVLGSTTSTDGTEELKNYANGAFVSNTVTYYVDDALSDTAGATHFDDIVSRPSVLAVAGRAGLGPRAHTP